MPTPDEIASANTKKEVLLRARDLPLDFLKGKGEWFRITIVSAKKDKAGYLTTSWFPIREYKKIFEVYPIFPIESNGFRIYLHFAKSDYPSKVVSSVHKLPYDIVKRLPNGQYTFHRVLPLPNRKKGLKPDRSGGKRVRRGSREYVRTLPHMLNNIAMRVRDDFKSSRSERSFRKRSTPRPAEEVTNGTYLSVRCNGGYNPPVYTGGKLPYTTKYRFWAGTTTPGFRNYPKKRLPVNAHTVYHAGRVIPGVYYNWHDHNYNYDDWRIDRLGYWASLTWFGDNSHSAAVRDKAVARLIKRGSNTVKGNLALTLAEANQTFRMFSNTSYRLVGAVSNLRRGNISQAIQVLWQGKSPRFRKGGGPNLQQSLAQNWLELQYGWKPLLNDIKEGLESLAQFYSSEENALFQVTASAKEMKETVQVIKEPLLHVTPIGELRNFQTQGCRIGIRYKMDDRLVSFLAQTGFTNPLNLAWELIPFSFVADWFLPIGPYLEAFRSWDGLQFVDGYQTQWLKNRRFGYVSGSVGPYIAAGNKSFECNGTESAFEVHIVRSKLTSFPLPHVPRFRSLSSVHKALNALALIQVVFGNGRRRA